MNHPVFFFQSGVCIDMYMNMQQISDIEIETEDGTRPMLEV